VLDCRWLGPGGAGRVTELVLTDLRLLRPPWDTVLWGRPERLVPFADVGAVVPTSSDPKSLFGQAAARSVPRGDVTVFFHQIRPLGSVPAVTMMYDTIPLRYGSNRAAGVAKRLYFRIAARRSARILTASEYSRRCLIRDARARADRIDVVSLPVDGERFDRITRSRATRELDEVALFVGRFAPHKNLRRLAVAFSQTAFAERGGRLELVGGSSDERADLDRWLADQGAQRVRTFEPCTEKELDDRLTSSRLLVMPSLEEGFGLPAFEAAAVGMPVVSSRAGAMADLPDRIVAFCDPLSVASIAVAIDDAASRAPRLAPHRVVGDLGVAVVRAVDEVLRQPSSDPVGPDRL
jgi:glycosyltransferase involved in cell wall biosynthesis